MLCGKKPLILKFCALFLLPTSAWAVSLRCDQLLRKIAPIQSPGKKDPEKERTKPISQERSRFLDALADAQKKRATIAPEVPASGELLQDINTPDQTRTEASKFLPPQEWLNLPDEVAMSQKNVGLQLIRSGYEFPKLKPEQQATYRERMQKHLDSVKEAEEVRRAAENIPAPKPGDELIYDQKSNAAKTENLKQQSLETSSSFSPPLSTASSFDFNPKPVLEKPKKEEEIAGLRWIEEAKHKFEEMTDLEKTPSPGFFFDGSMVWRGARNLIAGKVRHYYFIPSQGPRAQSRLYEGSRPSSTLAAGRLASFERGGLSTEDSAGSRTNLENSSSLKNSNLHFADQKSSEPSFLDESALFKDSPSSKSAALTSEQMKNILMEGKVIALAGLLQNSAEETLALQQALDLQIDQAPDELSAALTERRRLQLEATDPELLEAALPLPDFDLEFVQANATSPSTKSSAKKSNPKNPDAEQIWWADRETLYEKNRRRRRRTMFV